MKKTIFERKMENPKFRAVYNEVAAEIDINEQIARLRHEAKMSQAELAEKVGTSRPAIARYENKSYCKYNVGTLVRIGRVFHKKLQIAYI